MVDTKGSKRNKRIRLGVQLFFFILILLISINHQLEEKGLSIPFVTSASLHSVCPFGGVVSIYTFITDGSFVQKIHESSFVLLAIVILLSIVFGPVFCGWICPLGTIQELFSKIGKKIFKHKFNRFIPYKYDKYLRYLRYFVLVWVVFMTAYTAKLSFSEIDPYNALFNLWSSELALGGAIILALTLIASLFMERPWCKYACPFGAFIGLSNLIRFFKIRRTSSSCISCKQCDVACPMNIEISDKDAIKNHQCITCLKCTSEVSCPINDTVRLKSKMIKPIRVKTSILSVILLVFIFVGIYSSDIAGLWITESSKTVRTTTTGESAGQKNPADIKGSFRFSDISTNFDISVSDLQKAFQLNDVSNIDNFKCKDLEAYYGDSISKEIGTDSVRMFVALYKGIPYTPSGDIYLPEAAISLLKDNITLTTDQVDYIDAHTVIIGE